MSDLTDAVRERISVHTPTLVPPYSHLLNRRRARRRVQWSVSAAVAAVVGIAVTAAVMNSPAQQAVDNRVVGDQDRPSEVALSDMDRARLERVMGPIGGDGTQLARFPLDNGDELLLVGVQANGWTCLLEQRRLQQQHAPGGMACAKPNLPESQGNTGLESAGGSVIYPQLSEGPRGGNIVYTGAAPADTKQLLVTASNGQSVTMRPYDSGDAYRHLHYFILPWISGTSRFTALDADGKQIACGTTVQPNRC
jgi:hypothetical protein